ncbi:hypothetical protein NPIL_573151 [Nephila pilipes]|uniref:Uncharacterized protein n=1 Tax=Nephila pilipes TaxID=299642 RepID=A0A8X6T340_NEPPI|nr:hypothetical protein NPIL_573151 [Nephila pilipes]
MDNKQYSVKLFRTSPSLNVHALCQAKPYQRQYILFKILPIMVDSRLRDLVLFYIRSRHQRVKDKEVTPSLNPIHMFSKRKVSAYEWNDPFHFKASSNMDTKAT